MKNIFYHITKKTLKQNRTRTWLTIIGVLLSTAMITAVTTFGASFRQFLIDYTIQQDGNWHVSISNLTENDLKHITDNDSVAHTTVLTSMVLLRQKIWQIVFLRILIFIFKVCPTQHWKNFLFLCHPADFLKMIRNLLFLTIYPITIVSFWDSLPEIL